MFVHECIEKVIKKKFFIHPILVFVGRKNVLEFEPRDIAGVFVCDEKSLVKTLAEHIASDGRLPVEDIKKIIDVVESMAQINLNEV